MTRRTGPPPSPPPDRNLPDPEVARARIEAAVQDASRLDDGRVAVKFGGEGWDPTLDLDALDMTYQVAILTSRRPVNGQYPSWFEARFHWTP